MSRRKKERARHECDFTTGAARRDRARMGSNEEPRIHMFEMGRKKIFSPAVPTPRLSPLKTTHREVHSRP